MGYPDLQTVIRNYGIVTEWVQSRGRKYSLLSSRENVFGAKITLLYPIGLQVPADSREVRSELYLQAESIVELMNKSGFQFIKPPRIILGGEGGMDGQIEGIMEVEFAFLQWGVGPEWLYGTALLMRRRLKRRSSVRI